jgi:hypothetical protein
MAAQDDLLLALGRLEGKVDSILTTMRVHHEEIKSLDDRVKLLEQGRAWVLGLAAAVSVLVTIGIELFHKKS